ncbi:hypothetical protein SH528x_004790 [Novipirellula sp. SH528]|uniref:hypothetical protein n=1 Tax=Novipirellula sp. SH528 TaxID=3454466 RepID=UPI003FA0B6D3
MTDHQPPPVQPYQTPPEVKEARRPMRYRTAKLVALILILFGGGLFAYRATRVMRNDFNLNRAPVDPDWINTRYPPPPEPMPEELESTGIQGQAIDAAGLESASDLRSTVFESASGEPSP